MSGKGPAIEGITGVVLAGGENRRFPALKGFIRAGDSTIIERNTALLGALLQRVFVSTNIPGPYFFLGLPLIGDVLLSQGPMSGIYSSLINAGGDAVFVIGCDMPFVDAGIISLVCKAHTEAAKPVDATIPVYDGKAQPLCGVYAPSVLPSLEQGILNGKTSLRRFLSEIKTGFISEPDIRAVDPGGRSFININTVEDYERMVRGSWLMVHKNYV